MFAVTTTTNVASTAKTRFSGTKTTSSSRKSFSSIVKASSSSSEEKFDRREMLKNALVASVATVVATPKPVRANESSSRSSFRLLCAERALSLSLSLCFFREAVSRGFTRLSWIAALDFWISLLSLSSLFEKLRRRVKAARRECECDIFLLFLLFLYQKLTSKRSFSEKQTTKALALFGIGEKSDAKYEEDTMAVIAQVREVLDFPMGAEGREQSIEKTRALTNEWVARYRRSGDYSGRPSYGLTYSALNAVSGHFNNFGTKYPFPVKRKDRVFEELTSAETQISRGR